MSKELLEPFNSYYSTINNKKIHNFPKEMLKKMTDYLIKKYKTNIIQISENLLQILFDPYNKEALNSLEKNLESVKEEFNLYNSILENNTTISQLKEITLDALSNLIEGLRKNEKKFYNEVLNSDNPNLLLNTYYSLYLDFAIKLFNEVKKLKITDPNYKTRDAPEKNVFKSYNSLIYILGIPIILYINDKEVFPYLSEFIGAIFYYITLENEITPASNSWGYYLFSKLM